MQKTWADASALANAIEERALTGRNVVLSPPTAIWLARQIQATVARRQLLPNPSRFNIDLYDTGSCIMQVDANGDIVDVVAWARNALAAHAAFEELCGRNPQTSYHQRRKSWVEAERIVAPNR